MNILHIVSALDESCGGTAEVVPRMCEELAAMGLDVTILTLAWSNPADAAVRAEERGVNIKYCKRTRSLLPSLGYSKEFAAEVKQLVKRVDVVHLHGLWQWPCWRAAQEARRQRKPYVMQTHGFLEPERLKKSRIKKAIIGRFVERPNLAAASRVIATAESEKSNLIKYGVTTPVEVVPIGMDVTEIDAGRRNEDLLRKLGVPEGKKALLYLSRLAPIKGLDLLAAAWMRLEEFHRNWQLVIVGDDTQGYSDIVKRDYARIVTDGSASLPGPVYGRDKFDLLKSVDGFVLPTRSENFSIAVQEALAAEIPVVCTNGAPWGKIEDVGAGWWVDISVDGIEKGLRSLMSLSDEERREMGQCGHRLVLDDFSWKSIVARQISIYEQVVR